MGQPLSTEQSLMMYIRGVCLLSCQQMTAVSSEVPLGLCWDSENIHHKIKIWL